MRRSYAGGAKALALSGPVDDAALLLPVGPVLNWPDPADGPFSAVINRGENTEEKVLCSDTSGGFLTVVARGYDGTAAVGHSSGEPVEHIGTSIDDDEANEHVNSAVNVHGLSGGDRVLGERSIATVTGKSMSGLTNTFTNIPKAASAEISNDIANLLGADVILQQNIDNEAAARTGGDTTEATNRAAADANLQTQITTEVNARVAQDALLAPQATTYTKTEVDTFIGQQVADTDIAFNTYTPTITGVTSGGALGNGTIAAEYEVVGKMVNVWLSLTFGTSTSVGVGGAQFSLPVTAASTTFPSVGSGHIRDSSAAARRMVNVYLSSTTKVQMLDSFDRVFVDGNSPWTWAVGDTIQISFCYRAA